MKLTSENLEKTILESLFKDGEDTSNHVVGEGVIIKIGFHPERLKEQYENIKSMLSDLPDGFKKSSGGGWSFLQLCETKDGEQWADLHQTMDKLVALGRAAGLISFPMPRNMWSVLPGGMPYVVIDL